MTDRNDTEERRRPRQEEVSSLSETLLEAIALLDDDTSNNSTCTAKAIKFLTSLQNEIASASLFSNNDLLDDLPTSSLPLLAVEYHLARALSSLATSSSDIRQINVRRCRELHHAYLRKLDSLDGLMDDTTTRDYRKLLLDEEECDEHDECDTNHFAGTRLSSAQLREAKIARFRARKLLRGEVEKLNALRQRRNRLHLTDEEDLDGVDGDGLERKLTLLELRGYASDSLDELLSLEKELEVLKVMVRVEKEREEMGRHKGQNIRSEHIPPSFNSRSKPMEITRVTKDPATGQLQLRSSVFRPGWQQPTMTLAEFGDMEMARAKEREERQKQIEAENKEQPRRYDQLIRYGMEDDANLVDASAKLDRQWDDWKDANPRGSGNKMGDRGDRNI